MEGEKRIVSYRKYIPVIVVLVLGIMGYAVYSTMGGESESDDLVFSLESGSGANGSTEEESDDCSGVLVDIGGSVAASGVYCVEGGGAVRDALDAAGGITGEACLLWVERSLNRARALQDQEKLYVPSIRDQECSSFEIGQDQSNTGLQSRTSCPEGVISINGASLSELDELPGVGLSLAQRIIDARPYEKIEELNDVSGIGDATFEKLSPLVCL